MEIKGCDIVARIDSKLKERKQSRKHIINAAGLKSVQSVTDWSKGSIPAADKILYIADYLDVSIRWLLTGKEEKGLDKNEAELIRLYRILDAPCKAAVIGSARAAAAASEEAAPQTKKGASKSA
jgi:transcriptional regulator with XRE-family HTH domain